MRSMTGFATASAELSEVQLGVEIRAINSRYLDCIVRLPREYGALEQIIRREVGKVLHRGRIEVAVNIERLASSDASLTVYSKWFDAYLAACKEVSEPRGLWSEELEKSLAKEVLLKREVISDSEESASIREEELSPVIQKALGALVQFQEKEGSALSKDLLTRHGQILKLTGKIRAAFDKQQDEHLSQLKTRLQSFIGKDSSIPEERIVTEAAILAEKSDISEELVRLESHLERFIEVMKESPAGRKLDFLLQEFLREANTIASKIQNASVQQLVVDMKADIERMKEQVQNIE